MDEADVHEHRSDQPPPLALQQNLLPGAAPAENDFRARIYEVSARSRHCDVNDDANGDDCRGDGGLFPDRRLLRSRCLDVALLPRTLRTNIPLVAERES